MNRLLPIVLATAVALSACSDDKDYAEEGAESRCSIVNGGLVDECAEGSFCLQTGNDEDGEPEYACAQACSSDDECQGEQECYDVEDTGRSSCGPPQPVCDPAAGADTCECGFDDGTRDPIFLVMGTGADCVIVERDRTACFGQTGTCLNSCVAEFYRYDLGDGTALILRALQGSISDGWVSDGQTTAPISCPALAAEYPESEN